MYEIHVHIAFRVKPLILVPSYARETWLATHSKLRSIPEGASGIVNRFQFIRTSDPSLYSVSKLW